MNNPTRAELSLQGHLGGRAGADRIALLEAIGATGSITAAAKQVGLSYRAAWDAVQVLNNLFAAPLVDTTAGGAQGGAASVTLQGRQVIAAFRLMDDGLQRMLEGLKDQLSGAGDAPPPSLLWALNMKISARNALQGTISRITDGAVNAEVVLAIGGGAEVVAVITRQSVEAMGLSVGGQAIALINASSIILARGDGGLRTSARNSLAGTVIDHQHGAVNDEITLRISEAKTLTATVTAESAKALDLRPGEAVIALIKASHVILAVE